MITRVEVQNYKCLADVAVDLTPLHVVIGPNDSGKSSLLEAVAALVNVRARQNLAFPPGWAGSELVWCRAKGWTVTFRGTLVNGEGGRQSVLTQHVDFSNIGQGVMLLQELDPNDHTAQESWAQLGPALSFRFDPRELARPAGVEPDRQIGVDSSGHGLSMLLDDVLSDNRERFNALEGEFCRLFPRYTRLKLTRARASYKVSREDGCVEYRNVPGKLLWFVAKDGGFAVRAAQASEGTLIVLALLALKYLPAPPSVVLIEEPENSIHPQRLQDVVRIMREVAADGPQVLMASHSPYLLDYLEPEEVTVFTRDDTGAAHCLRMSDSEKVKREIKHFNLGEIWTADWEEKLLAKAQEGAGA